MPFIYKIYNDINEKLYIGKTTKTIEDRWQEHIYSALYREDKNFQLYNAIKKYGPEHFHIIQIEECPTNLLNDREVFWIQFYDSYNNGYNMTEGGDGTVFYSREQILEYWNQGYNQVEISKIIGCCRQTVWTALKAMGVSKEELSKHRGKGKRTKTKTKNELKQEKDEC